MEHEIINTPATFLKVKVPVTTYTVIDKEVEPAKQELVLRLTPDEAMYLYALTAVRPHSVDAGPFADISLTLYAAARDFLAATHPGMGAFEAARTTPERSALIENERHRWAFLRAHDALHT